MLALTQIGAVDEAEELLEQVLASANDVGLLSEQLSPEGDQLGNFPQAFTHIGIIACAFALEQARSQNSRRGEGASSPGLQRAAVNSGCHICSAA